VEWCKVKGSDVERKGSDVRLGVRGSEGLVRECVGHWEMRHALGMCHLGKWGQVPTLGSPPRSCHLS
jgi:hypothetical protein